MRVIQAIWVFVVLTGWAVTSQARDLIIIDSNDPSIEIGKQFDEYQPIRVAAGSRVVLRAASGEEITIPGPYYEEPAALATYYDDPPESAPYLYRRVVKSASQLVDVDDRPSAKLAVTRGGIKEVRAEKRAPWELDDAHTGESCLRPDHPSMARGCPLNKTDVVRPFAEVPTMTSDDELETTSFQAQLHEARKRSQRPSSAEMIP